MWEFALHCLTSESVCYNSLARFFSVPTLPITESLFPLLILPAGNRWQVISLGMPPAGSSLLHVVVMVVSASGHGLLLNPFGVKFFFDLFQLPAVSGLIFVPHWR